MKKLLSLFLAACLCAALPFSQTAGAVVISNNGNSSAALSEFFPASATQPATTGQTVLISFLPSAQPTEPTIVSVRGRIVRIRIPAGFDRVTLQQYVVPRNPARARAADRWRTLSTKYPRGAESVIAVRIPTLLPKRFLRVFGNKLEALPGSLLTGITRFLPDPIEADPTVSTNSLGGGAKLDGQTGQVLGNVAGNSDAAPRAVAESDIWKVQGDRLYFFNELRGLQVFDLAKTAAPALLGTLRLPGSGEDMYLLGSTHAVLLKRAAHSLYGVGVATSILFPGVALAADASVSLATSNRIAVTPKASGGESGEIVVADVRAGAPKEVACVPYEGTLAESRMVGSVLYLATNVNRAATDTTAAEYGVQLTSFDLADPTAPVKRDSIFLGGWANAVSATDRFFLVAKYASDRDGSWSHNSIDLIDISAPDGAMRRAGQAFVQGNVSSKFQLDIDGDVLTAVTQNWGAPDAGTPDDLAFRWTSHTEVQTFSIKNPDAPVALGNLRLAPGETVRATRFDADRVYVVTFRQIDPLFVVDLKDPAKPSVSGHVEAPGFSTYIEPLGDRLVTIGLVNWQPAVSLFDVADPAAPKLLSQIPLGAKNGWAHSEAVWNEKAFKVIPAENLILVPVSSSEEGQGWFSSVQLLDLLRDKIVKRGAIQHAFSPRRATLVNDTVVAISHSRLVTVDATNRDRPAVKADLEIAWSVNRVFNVGRYLVQLGGSADWGDQRAPKLTVSPSDDTDETLTSIDLTKLALIGATVKDDVLYLAQGETGYYYDDLADTRPAQPLTVSAYDLGSLPAVRLLGSASVRTRLDYGDLTPLWPSPGILVWAGSGGGSNWRGKAWNSAVTTNALIAPGYWYDRWVYVHTARLVAFDFTRPTTPKFLSDIKVGGGQPWDLSEPVETNGAVWFSYKFFGNLAPVKNTDPAEPATSKDPASPRTSRHFLLRVDYTDPAVPVIDDTEINLPGQLTGLARAGKLLFTIGQNYDVAAGTPISGESALQVSAYDGTAAHLLDTLPLASRNQPVSIQGETVFTLDAQPAWLWQPGTGIPIFNGVATMDIATVGSVRWWGAWDPNPKKSLLSAWRLDAAGKFHKLAELATEHDTLLFVFGSLVVTQSEERTLHLFDAADAAKLVQFGSFEFSGWVWPDLNHADGGLGTGLWVPLGAYGVETVAAPAGK